MSHQRLLWMTLIHLIKGTTWPSGNKDKGARSNTEKREKQIQPTHATLNQFPLKVAIKKRIENVPLYGKWTAYTVSDAFMLVVLQRRLLSGNIHHKPIDTHCSDPLP